MARHSHNGRVDNLEDIERVKYDEMHAEVFDAGKKKKRNMIVRNN